ncbi:hypothetical protein [Hahella sp. HN01]|uniref:hypothetical protein n=1 Tax=Hahella sp. HN01 TaxID=2847262 RepID=UPI001C1EEA1C|nr:hypothetical protein [Hahella sp. HN01]MBU6950650.1 hypothetical protein [Hahella sp. HN01]
MSSLPSAAFVNTHGGANKSGGANNCGVINSHGVVNSHGAKSCFICGLAVQRVVIGAATSSELTCDNPECRRLAERRAATPPALFDAQVKFHRQRMQERKVIAEAEQRRIETQSAEEAKQNQALYAQLAKSEGLDPEGAPVTIPTAPTRLTTLPKHRIRQYRDFLTQIISEACMHGFKDTDDDLASRARSKANNKPLEHSETLANMNMHLCTMCKGGCCTSGREHAYLSASVIRRFMRENPELRPRHVLQLYLDKLSGKSIRGSCINHTNKGCSLPREMRSDICNGYFCDSLKSFNRKYARETPPSQIIAIARAQDNWSRFHPEQSNDVVAIAIVSSEEAKLLPLPEGPRE